MIEKKLETIEKRFLEVEKLLSDPGIIAKQEEYKRYLKEHTYLLRIVGKYRDYRKIGQELQDLETLKSSDDTELKLMVQSEREQLSKRKKVMEEEIKMLLLPPDPNEGKNIIIEIRAGTGGDEAALFAGELFKMYYRYAENHGWKIEPMDSHPTGLGGFKEVIFMVSGKDVWKHLRFEQGAHRVQRVPLTEASGRIHTSAVTVAVLPEAEEVEVEIKPDELRIDTYRSSGAGGQHVNKTDSAIRITHLPTNIVVSCQDERSQTKNRLKAMKILRAKLLEQKQQEQQNAITASRKQQVGTGDRSEKIRTYNFAQNRITDHRIDFSIYRLKEALEGDIDELIKKLIIADQEAKLSVVENSGDK